MSDQAAGIALDSSNNVYVVGQANSDQTTFPDGDGFGALPGVDKTHGGGGAADAFVAKINASGSSLAYATYIGGSMSDNARGVAVDSSGNAYVTCSTQGSGFPELTGPDSSHNGDSDAFITKSMQMARCRFTPATSAALDLTVVKPSPWTA